MDNSPEPAAITQGEWTQVKLWHTVYGLFLWEFFTTLDYEWKVFRGHIPYRWTIWIYSTTRLAGLVGAILCFTGMDVTKPINCQAWISSLLIFSYISLAGGSLLIVVRIVAIWNRHKVAVWLAIGTWCIYLVFLIQGAARLRSKWLPVEFPCVTINTPSNTAALVSMAVTDIILLLIMFVGLLRLRRHGGGTFGLARLLWKQGLIWISLATIAEVPPAIFLALNLHDRLNIMFQAPAVITMTIASTRMYRSLTDYTSAPPAMHVDCPTSRPNIAAGPKQPCPSTQAPLSPMEISVCTVFEQHQTPQLGCHGPPTNTCTDEGVREKPNGSCLDRDVERCE